jgi:hypothetical protein
MSTSAGSLWGSGRRTASSTLLVILYYRSAQVGDHNISHRSLWSLLLCRRAGRSKHLVHPLPQRLPTLAKDEWSVDLQRSSNGLQTIVGSRWGRGRSNRLYVCIKKFSLPPRVNLIFFGRLPGINEGRHGYYYTGSCFVYSASPWLSGVCFLQAHYWLLIPACSVLQ